MSRSQSQELATSPIAARARLVRLQAERFEAVAAGVEPCGSYMTNLEAAIERSRAGYVTAVVTELAVLGAELGEPLLG